MGATNKFRVTDSMLKVLDNIRQNCPTDSESGRQAWGRMTAALTSIVHVLEGFNLTYADVDFISGALSEINNAEPRVMADIAADWDLDPQSEIFLQIYKHRTYPSLSKLIRYGGSPIYIDYSAIDVRDAETGESISSESLGPLIMYLVERFPVTFPYTPPRNPRVLYIKEIGTEYGEPVWAMSHIIDGDDGRGYLVNKIARPAKDGLGYDFINLPN